EERVHVSGALLPLVEEEPELGDAADLVADARGEGLADLRRVRVEPAEGGLPLLRVVPEHAHVDVGDAEVLRHAHVGDGEEGVARLVELVLEEVGHLPLEHAGDAVGADTHGPWSVVSGPWSSTPGGIANHGQRTTDHELNSELPPRLDDLERLDVVAHLDVVVAVDGEAALVAGRDLSDVVLEAAERADVAGVDDDAVADEADAVVPVHLPLDDVAAGDGAGLRDAERLAHLDGAEDVLLLLGREQPLERVAHLLDRVVDDGVEADVDLLPLGQRADARDRAHLEPDDDGVRGRREHHVALVDGADAGVDDVHGHLLVRQLEERVGEGLDGAAHVALDDEVELVELAEGEAAREVVEGDVAAGVEALLALELRPLRRDLARLPLVVEHDEAGAHLGRAGEAEDGHGRARAGLRHAVVALVEHGADAPALGAGHEHVAHAERAGLDEHRRHDAAALVQPRLDDGADGVPARVRLEL